MLNSSIAYFLLRFKKKKKEKKYEDFLYWLFFISEDYPMQN